MGVSVDTKARPISGWVVAEPPALKGPWPEALSRRGHDGWELVVGIPEFMKTYTDLDHAHFIFKRQAGGCGSSSRLRARRLPPTLPTPRIASGGLVLQIMDELVRDTAEVGVMRDLYAASARD
jgi:hypothetical protein